MKPALSVCKTILIQIRFLYFVKILIIFIKIVLMNGSPLNLIVQFVERKSIKKLSINNEKIKKNFLFY
jgi:hypothetical protein